MFVCVFKWGSHQQGAEKKKIGGVGSYVCVCVWMRPPAAHGCSAGEISAHLNSHLNPFTKGAFSLRTNARADIATHVEETRVGRGIVLEP